MKRVLTIGLLLSSVAMWAQDLSFDYQSYVMNWYNINPAMSGEGDRLEAMLNMRNHVKGFSNAPKNIMAGIRSSIGENQGIGARLVSDSRGAFQTIKFDLTSSYRVRLASDHSLAFGLSAGIVKKSLNYTRVSNYELLNTSDVTFNTANLNTTDILIGAGLFYTWKKKLELGLSTPHLMETSEPLNQYFNFIAGYSADLNDDFKVKPWVSYQNIPVTPNLLGIYSKLTWKDKIWTQLGFQTNNALNIALGLELEHLLIGYNYQTANRTKRNVSMGTHQIMLTFGFAKKQTTISVLEQLLLDLNALNKETMSPEDFRSELDRIKQQLLDLDIENAKGNHKEISEKLIEIEQKIVSFENNK